MSDLERKRRVRRQLAIINRAVDTPNNPFSGASEVLGLLATANGVKRAFGFCCILAEDLDGGGLEFMQELGRQLDLKVRVTPEASYWYTEQPTAATEKVNELACKLQSDHKAVWFYLNPAISAELDKVEGGKMDCGLVLGYPRCCVEWHERCRQAEAEAWFKHNPTANLKNMTIEKFFKDISKFSPREVARNGIVQRAKYPFTLHIACPQCLSDDASPTARANAELSKLAKDVNAKFHNMFTDPL